MKAIETLYNGCKFRSRLEARWAVFFDAAGIRYVYEPQGFELDDGTYYLPDFYLPELCSRHGEHGIYAEIKGELTRGDIHKAEQFSRHKPLILLRNLPPQGSKDLSDNDNSYNIGTFAYLERDYDEQPNWYNAYFYKRNDGKIALCDFNDDWYYDNYGGFDGFDCFGAAFDRARQARFEHGETPKA